MGALAQFVLGAFERVGASAREHNARALFIERFGDGTADAVPGLPRLALNGVEASLGYAVSSSTSISSGWQHLTYGRSSGVFFNGAPQLKLNAVYLHVNLKTSEQ